MIFEKTFRIVGAFLLIMIFILVINTQSCLGETIDQEYLESHYGPDATPENVIIQGGMAVLRATADKPWERIVLAESVPEILIIIDGAFVDVNTNKFSGSISVSSKGGYLYANNGELDFSNKSIINGGVDIAQGKMVYIYDANLETDSVIEFDPDKRWGLYGEMIKIDFKENQFFYAKNITLNPYYGSGRIMSFQSEEEFAFSHGRLTIFKEPVDIWVDSKYIGEVTPLSEKVYIWPYTDQYVTLYPFEKAKYKDPNNVSFSFNTGLCLGFKCEVYDYNRVRRVSDEIRNNLYVYLKDSADLDITMDEKDYENVFVSQIETEGSVNILLYKEARADSMKFSKNLPKLKAPVAGGAFGRESWCRELNNEDTLTIFYRVLDNSLKPEKIYQSSHIIYRGGEFHYIYDYEGLYDESNPNYIYGVKSPELAEFLITEAVEEAWKEIDYEKKNKGDLNSLKYYATHDSSRSKYYKYPQMKGTDCSTYTTESLSRAAGRNYLSEKVYRFEEKGEVKNVNMANNGRAAVVKLSKLGFSVYVSSHRDVGSLSSEERYFGVSTANWAGMPSNEQVNFIIGSDTDSSRAKNLETYSFYIGMGGFGHNLLGQDQYKYEAHWSSPPGEILEKSIAYLYPNDVLLIPEGNYIPKIGDYDIKTKSMITESNVDEIKRRVINEYKELYEPKPWEAPDSPLSFIDCQKS